jgi:hypothetical protein
MNLRIGFLITTLAISAFGLIAAGSGWFSERAPEPIELWPDDKEQIYLGRTEEDIVAEWGQPNNRWEGHYGNPPLDYVNQYPGAWTLVFKRPKGTFYISVHKVDDRWICFSASWLPKGMAW